MITVSKLMYINMSITTSIPDNILFTTPMPSLKKSQYIQSDSKSTTSTIQTHISKMFRIAEKRIAQLEAQNTTAPILNAIAVDKPSFNAQSLSDHIKSTISAPIHDSTCNNNMVDPVQLSNLNISTNNDTIGLTNRAIVVATAVSIYSSVTMLKYGNLTSHDIKQCIHSVLTQMNANNYFSPLLTTNFQSVSQIAAIVNPTIDSALYISLSKSIPPNTL